MAPAVNPRLIFDIGTSEGNDSQFYLEKGFQVVAVEADPVTHESYLERFAIPICEGRLIPIQAAAAARSGENVTFFRNDQHQGLSSLKRTRKPRYAETQTEYTVATVDYQSLIELAGIPYYCKIDIEGGEPPFVSTMLPDLAPEYFSVEIRDFELAEALFALGYRHFKLVDQQIVRSFEIPYPPLEGEYVRKPNWGHASGPFGRELPGKWLSFSELAIAYSMTKTLNGYRTAAWTWYDCHAWKPAI